MFLHLIVQIAMLCFHKGIPFVIENPSTSQLWITPAMQKLFKVSGAVQHLTDFCQERLPWRKRTWLVASGLPNFQEVCQLCSGRRGICSCSGKHHVQLCGRDDKGVFWTRKAQPYPMPLCNRIAQHVAKHL